MHTVEDVDGVIVARSQVYPPSEEGKTGTTALTLTAASGFVDGHYYPPESLTIERIEGIVNLRNICQQIIDEAGHVE